MCRCQGVFLAIVAPGVEQLFGKSIVSAATGTHISVLCAENMAREGSFQWVSKTWEVVDAHPDLAYWDKVSRSHNLKQCATSGSPKMVEFTCFTAFTHHLQRSGL